MRNWVWLVRAREPGSMSLFQLPRPADHRRTRHKKTIPIVPKPISPNPTDPVEQYARAVVDGKEIAGRFVRLACERHLRDLRDGEKRGIWWDWPAAQRTLGYFPDVLRLPVDNGGSRPFQLHPSQQFVVGSLFGWKGADGYRRFQVAYIEQGKGSGKSPTAAGIGNYMMSADGESLAEVYSGAFNKDQAKILFHDAVIMVIHSPSLARRISMSGGKDGDPKKIWNLAHVASGSFFRPIASEHISGRGKSGFRPHCLLFDEVHEHPSDSMIEMMRKNLGKNRNQPLMLMITNAGVYDVTSVCWKYHEYASKVLEGSIQDDAFFGYVCTLDSCEDCRRSGHYQPTDDCLKCDSWRDEHVWKKTNPLLDIGVPSMKYLRQQVLEAEGMPSNESKTRRLNFCEWRQSDNPFISSDVWMANGAQSDLEKLRGRSCYGALDLSGKNALTSLELVFDEDSDGKKDVLSFFWTPKDGLKKREEQDRAPYQQWVNENFLIAKPGKTIDYRWVAKQIGELTKLYDIQAIAFDRWRIDDLERELEAESVDVPLISHGQGFQDMNPAVEALEDDLLDGKLRHGNHPVLTWCVSNTRVVEDAHENRKFDKRKSTGRIDGAVALAMADNLSNAPPEDLGSYTRVYSAS